MLKYDNCKNCTANCEHAGKDREFVCPHGVSCKVERKEVVIRCTPEQYETIKGVMEELADLPWWDIEEEQREEVKNALDAVLKAKEN